MSPNLSQNFLLKSIVVKTVKKNSEAFVKKLKPNNQLTKEFDKFVDKAKKEIEKEYITNRVVCMPNTWVDLEFRDGDSNVLARKRLTLATNGF